MRGIADGCRGTARINQQKKERKKERNSRCEFLGVLCCKFVFMGAGGRHLPACCVWFAMGWVIWGARE